MANEASRQAALKQVSTLVSLGTQFENIEEAKKRSKDLVLNATSMRFGITTATLGKIAYARGFECKEHGDNILADLYFDPEAITDLTSEASSPDDAISQTHNHRREFHEHL